MLRIATLRASVFAIVGTLLLLLPGHAPAQESQQATPQQQQMLKQMREMFRKSMGRDPTAEEQQQFLDAASRTQIQMLGAVTGLRGMQMPPVSSMSQGSLPAAPIHEPAPAAPQGTLNRSNDALRSLMQSASDDGSYVIFVRKNDGFTVDGQPFIDPDGRIFSFGADPITGLVTYLVDGGGGTALVKLYNARTKGQPVLAGQITKRGNRSTFEGIDGQTAGGEDIMPMSRGLLVTRAASIVLIDWETGVSAKSLPDDFRAATYQNGDVGGTRNILLESTRENASLFGGFESLKESFGKSKASDYAFYNLDTGNLVPLQFTREKNMVISGKSKRDSIYEPNGSPHYSHYYWSIMWSNSRYGPLAFAIEKGLQDLNLIDLRSGEKHNVVHRAAGILSFDTVPLADGDIEIRGNWAFKDHPIRASEVLAGQKIQ